MTLALPGDDSPADRSGALVPSSPSGDIPGGVLDVEAAQQLTAAIKVAAESLGLLLWRAHEGKAHLALGFPDWRSYIEAVGISRSRSYQLLDHHRVTAALAEAAGVAVDGVVTEAIARDLKPRLQEVVEEVRDAVAATGGTPDPMAVLRVVQTTLDAARHPSATRLNVLPSMAALNASGRERRSSSNIWHTPREAVLPLLPSLPPPPATVWCPCDVEGSSFFVEVLREHGYTVIATDLATGQDFLAYTPSTMPPGVDVIATNPPFALKRRVVEQCVALGVKRWALLVPEISLGDWGYAALSALGDRFGVILLNKRIAYSEVFGDAPVGNPPFGSVFITCGLNDGQQIVFREVPPEG